VLAILFFLTLEIWCLTSVYDLVRNQLEQVEFTPLTAKRIQQRRSEFNRGLPRLIFGCAVLRVP